MKFLKEGTKGHIEIWYYSIVKIMRTQDISCYLLFWALGNGCLFHYKESGAENEYKNNCLQITESPADERAKNKNQSDTGVFPKSWENDNEIYCH